MKTRKDGEATRELIIEAACKVFGEKGYYKATHAEISRVAGVNAALINFHFGSKDELYRAVWQRVEKHVEELSPINGGAPPDAPADERLYSHVRALLNRALDDRLENFHRLRTMEAVKPTGVLDDLLAESFQKHRSYTLALISELLGPAATKKAVELCEMSLISQCRIIFPPHGCKGRRPHHHFGHEDIKTLARHITQFSLAGINAIRTELEKNCHNSGKDIQQ